VPGGGVALLRCAPALANLKLKNHDEALGVNIIKRLWKNLSARSPTTPASKAP